jgi:hypothetical protein
MFLDWGDFWDTDRADRQWLFEPILAYGRGHTLYAAHKVGKSLVMLWCAVQLSQQSDTVVIYLDYEMTEDDIYERLADMGLSADTDLSRLRYALLPSLPPLDTVEGGRALFGLIDVEQAIHPDKHIAVVIDTTSRAFQGPENDSDTTRAFYRCTGLGLKQRGVTWARLDHAGKDVTKGQRGSSAKGDDVDVVWRLGKTGDRYRLICDAARMSWVPGHVDLTRTDYPLGFTIAVDEYSAEQVTLANWLDALQIPVGTFKAARAVLSEYGMSASNEVVRGAVKMRKRSAERSEAPPRPDLAE